MARKKAPATELPLEERPLFLKALEYLPAEPEELEQLAGQMLDLFNDAMRCGSARDIETSTLRYEAVVYRLNGNTFFGSGGLDGPGTRLQKRFAAPAGTVPGWGQSGEYLLEVAGMQIRVTVDPWRGFDGVHSLGFHAVNAAAPFISETGFLSYFLSASKHVGQEFSQAVRSTVEQLLQGEHKPKAIIEKDRAKVKLPKWLAPALAGVTRNGQIAMPFAGTVIGETPEADKVPMSNAVRQRRHRQRLKELSVTEGLKAISLTRTDRMVLSLGLLAHEDLDHRPKDWETSKKPGFDALLTKLWPEGDDGRYLAEPNRSRRRPAGRLRDEIDHQKVVIRRLVQDNTVLRTGQTPAPAEVVTDTANPHNWLRTVELTQDDDRLMFHAFSVFFTARSDLEFLESPFVLLKLERIFQGSPLWTERAKAELDKDLGIINGNKHREADRKRGWKNYEDERAQNAKLFLQRAEHLAEIKRLRETVEQISEEIGGGAAPVGLVSDDAAKLRRQVAELEQENARVIVERGRALEAAEVLQARLKKAGLPFDYRKQPGE